MAGKKQYQKLTVREVRNWFDLMIKINDGYELDDNEIQLLGLGLIALDNERVPDKIKPLVENAWKYYEVNK